MVLLAVSISCSDSVAPPPSALYLTYFDFSATNDYTGDGVIRAVQLDTATNTVNSYTDYPVGGMPGWCTVNAAGTTLYYTTRSYGGGPGAGVFSLDLTSLPNAIIVNQVAGNTGGNNPAYIFSSCSLFIDGPAVAPDAPCFGGAHNHYAAVSGLDSSARCVLPLTPAQKQRTSYSI